MKKTFVDDISKFELKAKFFLKIRIIEVQSVIPVDCYLWIEVK